MRSFELQLKRIRKQAGLTQQQIADALEVKVTRYRNWEQGIAMMSLEQAYRVTELLGCTLDELVGRTTSPREYSDPAQEALNGYYESMNTEGRDALVSAAKLMSGSPDTRIEKEGAEPVRVQAAMA